MVSKALFSSNSDNWSTPQDIYEALDNEFNFNLDPCADESNHKCENFFTQNDDGLTKNWGGVSSLLQSSLLKYRGLGKKSIQRGNKG